MAVSQTTRLNIYRWSAGTDAFTRAQMDASHEELEDRAAGYSQAASRPAAALAYKGFFHYSTTGQLSYCDGSTWDDIAVENTTDGNIGEIDGTASAGTSASGLAYAEHKHSIATDAITSANIVSLDAAKLTGDLNADRIVAGSITDAKIDTLDASKLTGSLSLDTSGNAATADNATNVSVLADNSSSTAYLLFATGTGNTRARRDTNLSYNASSNTLTAGTFSGAFSGNVTGNLTGTATDATDATNATNVNVYADNTSTTTYPLFATGTGNTRARRDTGLSYNASSNTLTTTTFSGALSGNATSATEVSVLSVSTNATHYVTFADSTSGTDRARIDTALTYNPYSNTLGSASIKYTGLTLTVSDYVDAGAFVADDGTASLPAYRFASDLNTGMYRSGADELSFATNGTRRHYINASGTFIWVNSSGLGGPLVDTSSTSGYRYILQNQTYGTFFDYTSTRDRKDQITNVTAADSGRWIDALQPVTYIERWLGGGTEPEDSREFREADVQVGFIADDVLANANTSLFAQVIDDGRGGLDPAGWKWECVIAAAVAEIKSLRARVASLEA